MKTILTCLLLVLTSIAFAQTNPQIDLGVYKWITNVPMNECNRDGVVKAGTPATDAIAGQQFRILEIKNGNAIIQVLNYTRIINNTAIITDPVKFHKFNFKGDLSDYYHLDALDKKSADLGDSQIYFSVPVSYIISSASKWYGHNPDLSVGVLALPLKYRLLDGDFTGSFTLGATGGIKIRASHYSDRYHNFLIGFGISNITLDSNTVSKNKDKLVSNLSALTGAIGYLFQSGKYQAGIFIGKDFLTHDNQQRFNWRYQGKPWISIGFGLSIFGDADDKKGSQKTQQDN